MLLIHPVREIGRAVPVLVGALLAGRSIGGGSHQWIWPLVGAGFVIGFSLLRWFTTTYRFTTEQVQLRTGLVQRSTLAASTGKVRAVEVTAPLLHRLLGLAAVEIGTGAGDKPVKLDGLPAAEAARLRADLLQRRRPTMPVTAGVDDPLPELSTEPVVPAPAADELLYRFEAKWLRYAPLGLTGLATAGAILGFGFQMVDQFDLWPSENSAPGALTRVQDLGVATLIVVVALVGLVAVSVLAVVAAALNYFGFTLGRDSTGQTLHVQRGLLTTRSTSLETGRLRGVQVHRPLLLRGVGAARLSAIVTGLRRGEPGSNASTMLAPASPDAVVRRTGDAVLGTSGVLDATLRPHGPVATRRRYVRAVVPTALLAAGLVVAGVLLDLLLPAVVAAPVLVVLAALLGRSRARHLGHALTADHLVTQSGSLAARRSVVDTDATAAVTVRRSLFQRRAGVATVELALGAGEQGYAVVDLTDADADALADELVQRALRRH